MKLVESEKRIFNEGSRVFRDRKEVWPVVVVATPDIRIETCAQENCGAFTMSHTSALVRMIQWIGLSNKDKTNY